MISSSTKEREDHFSSSPKQRKLLSSLYRIAANGELQDLMLHDDPQIPSNDGTDEDVVDDDDVARGEEEKPISKPDNITVTLFSWNPPSIRVGWDFNDQSFVKSDPTLSPSTSGTSSTPETLSSSSESSSVRGEHRQLRLEAFRIIYHPTVTK